MAYNPLNPLQGQSIPNPFKKRKSGLGATPVTSRKAQLDNPLSDIRMVDPQTGVGLPPADKTPIGAGINPRSTTLSLSPDLMIAAALSRRGPLSEEEAVAREKARKAKAGRASTLAAGGSLDLLGAPNLTRRALLAS